MHAVAERKETSQSNDIRILYLELFPKCASYIALRGGNLEDAKDLFHDALILWMERRTAVKDVIQNDEAYIMTLVKNLWFRKNKREENELKSAQNTSGPLMEDDFYANKKQLKLINFLSITGRKCMDLLRSFYFEDKSIQELAKEYKFASLHSASAQKYKCIEKLRSVVKEKSIHYDDLE